MNKAIKKLGVMAIVGFFITSCSENNEIKNTPSLVKENNKVEVIDSIIKEDTISNSELENKAEVIPKVENIVEELVLISGDRGEDGGTITFKNSKKKELFTSVVPDFITWNEDEYGSGSIDESFCNKKYIVTYKMENEYSEPGNSWSKRMNIIKMERIK
jgi:hypothetical protein